MFYSVQSLNLKASMELIDAPLYILHIFHIKINSIKKIIFKNELNLSCLFFVPIKNCFISETTFDISQDLNSTFHFDRFVILIGPNSNHVESQRVYSYP